MGGGGTFLVLYTFPVLFKTSKGSASEGPKNFCLQKSEMPLAGLVYFIIRVQYK